MAVHLVTSHSNASHADAWNDEGGGHYYDIPDFRRQHTNTNTHAQRSFKKGNEDSVHVYVNAGQHPFFWQNKVPRLNSVLALADCDSSVFLA